MTGWLSALSRGALRVAVGGEPVAEHCAGLAGGTGSEPCTARTRFQIASVSKQFTAAAVLVLVQRGHLATGDPVTRWFPGGPDGWAGITVHHLLSHTSGLGHWEDFPEIDMFAEMADEQLLEAIRGRPLLHAPGRRFSYSSLGFCLLAQIVEKVSGCGYAQFVSQALLAPAGLADTFAGSPGPRPHVALGHAGGVPAPSFALDQTGKGAGDVYSTVADLDRWNRRLPAVLRAHLYQTMLTGHAAAADSLGTWGPGDAYGYGWFLSRCGPLALCYHSGHNSGFNSFSGWLPERKLSVAVLANDDSVDPMAIARVFLADNPQLLRR